MDGHYSSTAFWHSSATHGSLSSIEDPAEYADDAYTDAAELTGLDAFCGERFWVSFLERFEEQYIALWIA